ncbi:MAG TPA: serine/threonine-protein kinase, partial [Solirubrobacteraceae bacterium]
GTLIAEEGPLPPGRAVAVLRQIADALDAAHARGLVHRDVKPANVLLEHGDAGRAYLADFGLTKEVALEAGPADITQSSSFVGTVDYAAPEQLSGEPVDARADVYALGATMFHALTGHVPFEEEGLVPKLFAHLNSAPPHVSASVPRTPPALDAAVWRAMAKAPEDRPRSAGALAEAAITGLQAARAAPPPSLGRSPLVLLSAVGAAVAVVGVGVVVALGSGSANPKARTAPTTPTPEAFDAPGPRALPTAAELPSCDRMGLKAPPHGTGRCRNDKGGIFTIANRAGTIHLKTLDASLVGPPTIVRRLSNPASGLSAVAKGRFILLRVRVHNRLDRKVVFDPSDDLFRQQTQLLLGRGTPTHDAKKSVYYDREAFQAAQVLPHPLGAVPFVAGETDTGTLVYDYPAKDTPALREPNAILVIGEFGSRFGDQASEGGIRLWK